MKPFDQVRDFLSRRRNSYCAVFLNREHEIGPRAEEVLADLARFCRADTSCFHADPRVHAALEGRREVWLRIQQHLRLSDEQLARIYAANLPITTNKE